MRGERGGAAAEVEIVEFELGRPRGSEGVFDADAGRPAKAVIVGIEDLGKTEGSHEILVMRVGAAALDVEQGMAERIADPSGQRPHIVDAAVAEVRGNRAARVAIEIGGASLEFEAPHDRTVLEIVTGLQAAEDAAGCAGPRKRNEVRSERTRRSEEAVGVLPVLARPGLADMRAEIEAGPAPEGNGRRGPYRQIRRTCRRHRRQCDQRNAGKAKFSHMTPQPQRLEL